ncbi:hypothetical protein OIPHN260_04870 [Enterobacter roggenkampii]|uniref:Uncharacterized protein n=1 Tax=Enterobacter roggenkampii TaxID=1812935 RepID=A0AAU9BMN0_9ENTR|nr:hypothetical protein OIPHN260_04870 [Enterobacter roggenkampii]
MSVVAKNTDSDTDAYGLLWAPVVISGNRIPEKNELSLQVRGEVFCRG